MRGHQTRARPSGTFQRPAHRRMRPDATVAQWLMLLVALAGLMAMHGLSDHGVGGPGEMSSAMSATTMTTVADGSGAVQAGPVAHAGQGAAAAPRTSARAASSETNGTGGGHGDHGGMLTGMCLAVMAAVLALGAAAWRTRLPAYLRHFFGDLSHAALTTLRARSWGPAPPDLKRLSIHRC